MLTDFERKILQHPENQTFFAERQTVLADVSAVDTWALGTHPDLVDKFWALGVENSPEGVDPRAVVAGSPALVHPASAIIYGAAEGTSTHVLRLPPKFREALVLKNGAELTYPDTKIHISRFGNAFAFIETWTEPEIESLHRAAYDYAA